MKYVLANVNINRSSGERAMNEKDTGWRSGQHPERKPQEIADSELNGLLCEKTMTVVIRGEFTFEMKDGNYVEAFDEAVRSITIDHPGYKYSSFT
jgi:hypothetical protein